MTVPRPISAHPSVIALASLILPPKEARSAKGMLVPFFQNSTSYYIRFVSSSIGGTWIPHT